jgi:hypothetical protein
MQTSVSLQEPYSFSIVPIIVLVIIAAVLLFVLLFLKKNKEEQPEVKAIPQKNIKNIPAIKNKHLRELEAIEYQYKSNKIELRKAYQMISENVRLFVFEVTDITTQNYTLMEIKKLNIPNLYDAIAEYYEPEFSKKPSGDFINSVNKAKTIIQKF